MRIPEKYKTLFSNTGLLLAGNFGSKLISFFMLPFYTSWLSVDDFGTSDIINVYSTVLVSIVSLCIGEAIFIIPIGRTQEEQKKFFSSSLAFALLTTVLLLLIYVVVVVLRGNSSSSFASNMGYITLLCGSTIYMSIAQQFCKCINKIKVYAGAGVINALSVAGFGFAFIKSFGLMGYVASLVLGNIIALIYIFIRAGLSSYISVGTVSVGSVQELLKYSIPLIPNSIMWLVVSYINRPIMEISLGVAAIGLFSLASRFPNLILTVYNTFSNSWQISVLQEFGKDSYEAFYNRVCVSVFVGMCLCVSIITIIIAPVIHLLFNEIYYAAIDYIPWLCLATPFSALSSIIGANFSAIRKSKYYFYSSIWSAISALVLNIIFMPIIGLWGACLASVVSYVIGLVSRIIYSRKIVHLQFDGIYLLFIFMTGLLLIFRALHISLITSLIVVSCEVAIGAHYLRIFRSKIISK